MSDKCEYTEIEEALFKPFHPVSDQHPQIPLSCKEAEEIFEGVEELTKKYQLDTHYKQADLEVWDVVGPLGLSWWGGNVLKYLARHQHKKGKDDLLKALDYLLKELSEVYDVTPTEVQNLVNRHRWQI